MNKASNISTRKVENATLQATVEVERSTRNSFKCSTGYEYNDASKTCIDINECKSNYACDRNQICMNTVGSFICRCIVGYFEVSGLCYGKT